MTGSVFDYSVAAVERVACAKRLTVVLALPDYVRVDDKDGKAIDLHRSPMGHWYWAWNFKDRNGSGYMAYTREGLDVVHRPPYPHDCEFVDSLSDLDELGRCGVRAYSTPADAIRKLSIRRYRSGPGLRWFGPWLLGVRQSARDAQIAAGVVNVKVAA
ncbi:MAG TPA: hypothetical protein VGO06_16015 [Bosea sp. (in: a-proteobacteria)]|jgi:hypothetical protein|uniref:hypothetical protein n=1 Tax=Bosea sp. (in: a-proteobacteria) TaxID=1871050 RepID=UPI002E15CA98|nr:hypothetical protein [Bosea sp. (in: a-proteobacteria)]